MHWNGLLESADGTTWYMKVRASIAFYDLYKHEGLPLDCFCLIQRCWQLSAHDVENVSALQMLRDSSMILL